MVAFGDTYSDKEFEEQHELHQAVRDEDEYYRRKYVENSNLADHHRDKIDMVNHPPHYSRGPTIKIGSKAIVITCIQVMRWIKDARLATAFKYIWRVAFGGKENDREDIQKAIWYLNDWLENKVD